MRAAALVLLAGMATPVAAFDGLYRPDEFWAEGWDCQTVGMDGGALAVREGRFYGVENTCELTNPTAIRGMDGILYDAVCSGEGETETYRMMLMQIDGGLAVVRGGAITLMKRCD